MLMQRSRTANTTRFRCGHCGNRLVMHNRHLRRLVACHGCGRATHPVAKRLGAMSKAQVPKAAPPSRSEQRPAARDLPASPPPPAPPARPVPAAASPAPTSAPRRVTARPVSELSAGPLVPLALFGMTGAAFFFAVSLMSYASGFISALLLVAVAAAGMKVLRRGTTSVRDRLRQIEALRFRHGTLRVAAMLFAWLWSQPPRRLPWAGLLVLGWGAAYVPYCLSALLLPAPRVAAVPVRA